MNAYPNPYATHYLETYVAELVKMTLSANADNLQSTHTPLFPYVAAYLVLPIVCKFQHIRLWMLTSRDKTGRRLVITFVYLICVTCAFLG